MPTAPRCGSTLSPIPGIRYVCALPPDHAAGSHPTPCEDDARTVHWTCAAVTTFSRQVLPRDLASALFPEVDKADVLASTVLLGWCELAVMLALGGCSLGVDLRLAHKAPALLGSWVTITVTCLTVNGPDSSTWTVTAHDELELLATGSVEFRVVDPVRYDRRLARKREALAALTFV